MLDDRDRPTGGREELEAALVLHVVDVSTAGAQERTSHVLKVLAELPD